MLAVVLAGRLCAWQLSRAAQKETLQAALDSRAGLPPMAAADLARDPQAAAAQHYRPVQLRGRWVNERTVYLENRQMNGRPGFYVVTPLQLSPGDGAVLVQRGWAPRDQADRTRLPALPQTDGEVELRGLIAPPPARLYDFAPGGTGAIRQNLDLGEFSRESGLVLRPLSVMQLDAPGSATPAAADGLLRQWPRPALDVHKHYGYAFQWFALGALMAGLYVWFQLVRPRLQRRP